MTTTGKVQRKVLREREAQKRGKATTSPARSYFFGSTLGVNASQ